MLTMAIGGLWHGANWTYVVWGVMHGSMLAVERYFKDRGWNVISNKYIQWILTFLFVSIAWVFFRSPNFHVATVWLEKIFFLNGGSYAWDVFLIPAKHKDRFYLMLAVALGVAFTAKNTWQIQFKPSFKNALILALLFVVCLSFMGEESPFLYFQF
jgi:alginate O-acetyltransferase complex protein AlgI